jgi:hypothetical protein
MKKKLNSGILAYHRAAGYKDFSATSAAHSIMSGG